MRRPRLPKPVLAALDGADWRLAPGKRHWRLLIGGRQAVVFGFARPFRQGDLTSTETAVARIRRFRREARP